MSGLLLTLIVIFLTLLELDVDFKVMRIMAAFATLCLMLKFYDWLTLFEPIAFYIILIG